MPIPRENLVKAQASDISLIEYFDNAVDNVELLNGTGYYVDNQLLLRQYRPNNVKRDEDWAVVTQIVLPKDFRNVILELAHGKYSGHFGINKTCERVLEHFYWPGLRSSVVKFVKSCHICQLGGKPNQVIPKAPLKPIPVVEGTSLS